MRVILAYNYDPSHLRTGGGITYVHNLIVNLLDNGVSVTLFGVKLADQNTFVHPNFTFIPVLTGTDNWWKFIFKLGEVVRRTTFEDECVIHAHHPLVLYPFIRHLNRYPKVCTFHGIPLDWVKVNFSVMYHFIKPLYVPFEKYLINHTDIITTAGEYPKLGLVGRYADIDTKKIHVIPSGVDLQKFRPMDKAELRKKYGLSGYDNVLVFLGRLSEQKNIGLALKSYKLHENRNDNSIFIIVGKGEKEEDLKLLSKKLEIRNLRFTGEVAADEVPELLNCADMLLLTSVYEASPTVVKEALACGVPVITTLVGDVDTIISQPLYGCIVSSDEASISNAMGTGIEFIKNHRKQSIDACRTLAINRFSFQFVAGEFIAIYRDLLQRKLLAYPTMTL